ncbi:MAG: hypothetical protein COA32_13680 [Fluviicola sp.]|nr:MAG: hypothetical protein COA32_13680 [Fluviicola sp.]
MLRLITIILFCFLWGFNLYSADETFSDRLEGSSITTSNTLEVIDDKYPIMDTDPNWEDLFYNKKVVNKIRLGVLPETELTTDETCEVILDVSYRLADGTTQSFACTLAVEYLSNGTLGINDKSTYVFEDAHVVQISIDQVTSGAIDNFFLESIMEIERYYAFDGGAVSSAGVQTISNDEFIEFHWAFKSGAESYELEYMHVNNYTLSGGSLPESVLTYDFYKSATRITTEKQTYKIPNTFDKGYLIFRVRGVGKNGTDYDKRYEGSWNVSESGMISSVNSNYKLTISLDYHSSLNWSYQATMAEHGKRMQGVSYMDGLGRSRQQLIHNPATEQIIVSNTYYDYHGRPVIQDLGTPVDDEALKHYPAFNRSAIDQQAFGPEHFDEVDLQGSCPALPDAFDTNYGAGEYYSTNNPAIDGANHNVPDGEGYPYSQIQYMPDQTGRVKRSGAFGDVHQIGNGKATKYMYSTPSQEELNRLFGSEVGYRNQYQKRMMQDANGQIYVTYYDLAGRVIASGLAGAAPQNLEAIDGETPLEDFQFSLNSPPAVGETASLGTAIEFSKPEEILSDGQYTFNYAFTPAEYEDLCMATESCFDCVYDLEILIKDAECENDTLFYDKLKINGGELDSLCQSTTYNLDTLLFVNQGTYTVSRKLSIDQQAIADYWCTYLEANTCAPSYSTIYNDLYETESFNLCLPDTFDPDDFQGGNSTCELQEKMMLSQVSPGGQYALYDIDSNGDVDATSYPLSLFNSSNSLPDANASWKNPITDYLDEDGNTDYITIIYDSQSGTYTPELSTTSNLVSTNDPSIFFAPPEDLLNALDFIANFKPSWAASLLDYHPEACYLDFCYLNASSENYNNGMDTIYTFDEACSEGYFNPLDILYGNAGIYNVTLFDDCFDNSVIDTFFLSGYGQGDYFYNAMKDSMSDFIEVGSTPTKIIDIWTYSIFLAVYNGDDFDTYDSDIRNYQLDTCDMDAIWVTYRRLYKQLKQYYVKQQELEYAMTNDCYNGCIGEVGFDAADIIVDNQSFDNYTDQSSTTTDESADADQPCYLNSLYTEKQQVFPDYWDYYNIAQDTAAMQDSIDLIMQEQCELSCETKASDWIAGLYECPNVTQTTLDNIKAELIELCQMGCGSVLYPEGVSVLSGATTTNGNSSFEEVLEYHLGTGYESDVCNFYLLDDVPPAQGTTDTLTYATYLDDCGCDILMQAHHDFYELEGQGNLPAGVENVEEMLIYNEGISIEDANQLLCECDKYFNGTLETWTAPGEWTTTAANNLVAAQISVAPEFSCSIDDSTACFDCDYIDSVHSAFITTMENQGIYDVDTSANYGQLLSGYMNAALDYDLLAEDYLDFMAGCNATTETPYCRLNTEATAWLEVMNILAKRGQLSATEAAPVDLYTDNIAYAHNAFGDALQAPYFWSCEGGGDCDDETLTVYFGEDALNSCSFTLNFPVGSAIANDQIIGFSDLQMLDTTCSNLDEFSLIMEYIECGKVETAIVTGSTTCIDISTCVCGDMGQLLCNDPIPDDLNNPSDCYAETLTQLAVNAEDLYTEYVDTLYDYFETNYNTQCKTAFATESFYYTGDYQMYQFTLFYYDQAGNLVQTIAPEGISPLDQTQNTNINNARDNVSGPNDTGTTGVFPTHEYVTEYHYNSYGQLTQTTNPDQEGNTVYWYDRYGRIIASQNPHQAQDDKYSYTFYDEQGRPLQVGQVETTATLTETITKAADLGSSFESWVTNGSRTEVTITQYDENLSAAISNKFENGQQNLRLRVASILYFALVSPFTDITTDYQSATHYSYDPHGNVIEILQDVPMMQPVEQDIKSTQYDYDLISGNMNKVEYQKEEIDGYTHIYHYDELNRLKEVQTSADSGVHVSTDAKYQYYDYGPLARVEIGEYEVQGTDYAYTINGWLKGANSNTLDASRDMGKDGTTGYYTNNTDVHRHFAVDAFGFSLNYFDGDYAGIGTNTFEADYSGHNFGNASANLYNGNIRHMVTAIEGLEIQGYAYTYDQLQRLKKMEVYRDNNLTTNNNWSTSQATTDYLTQISYDKNGNITNLARNGYSSAQLKMDRMAYSYQTIGGEKTNRLDFVQDYYPDYSGYEDIKQGQTTNNYQYNKIGELVEDVSEDMTLNWRYGDHKLDEITRTDQDSPNLEFVYNPVGVRVAKIEKPRSGGVELSDDNWIITYYAYGANGQLMATYDSELYNGTAKETTLDEQYIYGSKRVGVIKANQTMYDGGIISPSTDPVVDHTLGRKRYELSNHLGNVLATITDRKVWNNTDSNYEPVVTMKADYFPFGFLMPGRFESVDDSRHLFNGMEADGEVSGEGNSYTTQFRQYDPRLGRWKSRDPLQASFPWQSPYVAFDNNPIYYTDPLGLAAGKGEGDPPAGLPENPNNEQVATADNGKSYTYSKENDRWIYTTPDVEVVGRAKKPIGYYSSNNDLDVETKDQHDGFDPNTFYIAPENDPRKKIIYHITDRRKTDTESTEENNEDHVDADDSADPDDPYGEIHYSDEKPGGPGTIGYGDDEIPEYPPKVNLYITPGRWETSERQLFLEWQAPWNSLDDYPYWRVRMYGGSQDTVFDRGSKNPDKVFMIIDGEKVFLMNILYENQIKSENNGE